MSATNQTAVYGLPIFLVTDVPSWLTDWNGAMSDIDTAIAAAKAAADAAASTAGTAATDIVTINGQITSLQNTVGTHTSQIGTISGNINTINSLIGNGAPTTTDQTIIGAINELNAKDSYQQLALTAATTYNDLTSLLSASIADGKIPHIKCEYTVNTSTFHNLIVKFAYNGYDSNNVIIFSTFGGDPAVLYSIVVRTTGTEAPSTGHSVTNMVLYY